MNEKELIESLGSVSRKEVRPIYFVVVTLFCLALVAVNVKMIGKLLSCF